MRTRFAGYLAMGVVSAFLIIASYAFVASTFWWIALIGGIVLAVLAVAEVGVSRRMPALAAPAVLNGVLGIVMAIIAVAASEATAADWGFGLAIGAAALSVLGLTGHELLVEREVEQRDGRHGPGVPAVS